ncbi:hypothetical protein GCM10010329_85670 [Streptomyces spiroverticillatus]|nr:hypothetical protein GCM10010329_85670 [Streptomyces spiroverticillatus]
MPVPGAAAGPAGVPVGAGRSASFVGVLPEGVRAARCTGAEGAPESAPAVFPVEGCAGGVGEGLLSVGPTAVSATGRSTGRAAERVVASPPDCRTGALGPEAAVPRPGAPAAVRFAASRALLAPGTGEPDAPEFARAMRCTGNSAAEPPC